jgi:hypothetical protein
MMSARGAGRLTDGGTWVCSDDRATDDWSSPTDFGPEHRPPRSNPRDANSRGQRTNDAKASRAAMRLRNVPGR